MSSEQKANTTRPGRPKDTPSFERYILIPSIFSIIILVLCILFIIRCLKQRHRNRIVSPIPPAQQYYDNTNSAEPPPYNWYSESPPPPYTVK